MDALNRREFLKQSGLFGAGFFLASHFPFPWKWIPIANASPILNPSPLAPLGPHFESGVFNGDEIHRPHQMIWDRENYIRSKGGRPRSSQEVDVVITGGGMSGLLSAYFLRDLNPILLEQASRFGGNSQGEIFQGSPYSIGAAYVTLPEEGDEIDILLKDLNLRKKFRTETEEETRVHFEGCGLLNLWRGETDPAALESVREVTRVLTEIYNDRYPDVPWTEDSAISFEEFSAWDQQTAEQWLQATFPNLHPHVREYFQLYCWSSFGGSLSELSAAQFLNFVAAETAGVMALPGGNSAITAALYEKLTQENQRIHANTFVLEVENVGDRVHVLYEDAEGKLQTLSAKAAIVAAPKYVARHLVRDLPLARAQEWKILPYRAYVVANVLLKTKVPAAAYDIFHLKGRVPSTPSFGEKPDRAFTDFVMADWANYEKSDRSILTIYKAYPYEGARDTITGDFAFARIRKQLEESLPKILHEMGIREDAIEGVRLTRWGHALPLARPGMVSTSTLGSLTEPVGRIHFANQDCYFNPAFETCFASAKEQERLIRSALFR